VRLLISITFIHAGTSGKIAAVGIIIKVFLTRQWPELHTHRQRRIAVFNELRSRASLLEELI